MARLFNSLTLKATIGALLVLPALAHAESVLQPGAPSTNSNIPFVPAPRQGEPLRLTWQDGRQAILRIRRTRVVQIPLKMAVTENLCEETGPRPPANCVYRVATQNSTIDLAWENHPDSSKVGQTVKSVYVNSDQSRSETRLETQDFASATSKMINPHVSPDSLFDELVCEDFRWLTGADNGSAPEQLTMDAWSSELMAENPETGENENRVIGSGYGMKFVKVGPQTLRLVGARALSSHFGGQPTIFGDVISVIMRQKNGETCQITIKPNLGEVTQVAAQVQADAEREAQYVPVTDFETPAIKGFLENNLGSLFVPAYPGVFE